MQHLQEEKRSRHLIKKDKSTFVVCQTLEIPIESEKPMLEALAI